MKRMATVGLALTFVAITALWALGGDDDRRGPGAGPGGGMMGGWAGGMMGGWGGGMMGGWGGGMMGPGMMGGWGWDDGLTKEQSDKVNQIQFSTMTIMHNNMWQNRERMQAMQKALSAYPIDEKAAMEQWRAMNSMREEMFKLHLSTMAQAQQILGKEKWEELNEGSGGSGRRGPGMMRNR
jgi:Spy/CpxP family protein refolding chaperone